MPTFQFSGGISGLAISGGDVFSVDGVPGETVQVRLTDSVLRQDTTAPPMVLSASYSSATKTLTLERTFTPPARFLGGALELDELELRIQCAAGSGAALTLDDSAATPVEVSGSARWVGDGPQALGAPGGELPFDIGLNPSGFALALADPVELDRIKVELSSGSLAAQVLPAEQALLLDLAGQAALDATVASQIENGLERIFGAGSAPDLTPPPFRVRLKLRLADLAPAEPPRLSLFPDWDAGSAPALPTPPDLGVQLGMPRFDFTFPDFDAAGADPDFGFGFRNCAVRFPELAGLEAFTLEGSLEFRDGPGTEWSLGFLPSLPGTIQMPDVFRFLVARIAWLAEAPDVFDVPELLSLTQGDFEWFEMFAGLLPGPGDPIDAAFLDGIRAAFDGIVDAALALPDAPDLPDLFALSLAALAERADELYEMVADAWEGAGPSLDQTLDLIIRLADLPDADLDRFLIEILPRFDDLIAEVLEWGAGRPFAGLEDFLRLWVRTLAAGLEAFDANELADLIFAALKDASDDLERTIRLGSIPMLSGIPGLNADAFKLPFGSVVSGLGLSALAVASPLPTSGVSGPSFGDAVNDFAGKIEDAIEWLLAPIQGVDASRLTGGRVLKLLVALFTNAEGDFESEVILLQWSRNPLLLVPLFLAASFRNLLTKPIPWTDILWQPIEDNPHLKVKRLPRPMKGATIDSDVKYLILSDIHRDSAGDARPFFQRGSIAHFRDNRQMYLDILEWAHDENYMVIEAGDCEELWFIRDFEAYDGPAAMMHDVIESNEAIYDKLVELHNDGLYLRLYGNHDSYLRDPATRQELVDRFESSAGAPSFEIYDYFIVDGVNRFEDHGVTELAGEVWDAAKTPEYRLSKFVEELTEGRLGLDSAPYTDRDAGETPEKHAKSSTRLIITHGHQFDFWNCDEHSLAGKMIANSLGVLADIHDDPFQDLGGIAFGGGPVVDFESFFANMTVFSNWPSYDPARAFAHRIQHMHESDRVLYNDIQYPEILPALMAAWGMPVHLRKNWPDAAPEHRWSNASANPLADDWFLNFLGNAILIGHTHFPHSRPYYDITALLFGPLQVFVDALRDMIEVLLFGAFKPSVNLFRSQLYNSGTAGWMEGVVWAIEVSPHGQARSIFWTRDTKADSPQEMDWELQRFSDDKRAALDAARAELGREVEDWVERFLAIFIAAGAGVSALSTTALVALRDLIPSGIQVQLDEIDVATTPADEVRAQLEEASTQVGSVVLQILLSLMGRRLGDTVPMQTISVSLPVDGAIAGRMGELEGILAAMPDVADEAVGNVAAVWVAVCERLPFVAGGRGQAPATTYPVLRSVLGLLPMLPAIGTAIEGSEINADVQVADGTLTLEITID